MVIPSIPSPPSGPSIDADPERPFACDGCGKTYKFIGNLERVSLVPVAFPTLYLLIFRPWCSIRLYQFDAE